MRRMPYDRARKSPQIHQHDYIGAYVADLANVVDMDAIRASGVKIGIDPLGGASVHFWQPIIERYGIAATIVNDAVDPTFRFMTVDWDGKVRMDCSSPYAMARLIGMRDKFDVAFANDTDADRHGIVTRSSGLMNPNHYLAAAISYLYGNRPEWGHGCAVGKTVVSSGIIDRVVAKLGRKLVEVPVGFKWFVDGLLGSTLGFAGEESAGASFLRRDGSVWTTDKDGLTLGLLAAEITARTKRDPGELYAAPHARVGRALLREDRRARDARTERSVADRIARADRNEGTCRRADPRAAHRRPGQRPSVRRDQGDCRERMVRGAAVRHGGCLQDLCREFPQRKTPASDPTGGARRHRASVPVGKTRVRRCRGIAWRATGYFPNLPMRSRDI